MAAGASHLVAQGRRSGVARGRRKSPVEVSGLPLRELRVLLTMADLMSQKIVQHAS
jgi:hypothetical protein